MAVYLRSLLSALCALAASIGLAQGGLVGSLTGIHRISGDFYIINSTTIHIENFNYDATAPGAFLYYYPPGVAVERSGGGVNIPVPASIGQGPGERYPGALRAGGNEYMNEDITVNLPPGVDACDISTITVWCQPFTAIFAQLLVPRDTFVNNGADPCRVQNPGGPISTGPEFDNCEVLDDTLQLSWRVDNDNSQVRFRLCGCSTAGATQYLGFGLSGSDSQTLMFGADATIAYVDENGARAEDYYLSGYTQCRGGSGACPDTVDTTTGSTCTNDVTDVSGFVQEGQQCISFTRPFNPTDSGRCDRPIDPTNQNQYIVWGIGSLGETAFQHHTRATAMDGPIHLGRTPSDECTGVDLMCQQCDPFPNNRFIAREDATFTAVIGPSANPRGYTALTGLAGWGIAWYINNTLIPELVVERGRTYTFLIYGGNNPADDANYHPFYITNSVNGGRLLNTPEQRMTESVFAGFDGSDQEIAVGSLCEFIETSMSAVLRQSCNSYDEYINSLNFACLNGTRGVLTWTPDQNTPDIVYYQCASHLNLGHAIQVINQGDPVPPPIVPQTGGATPLKLSTLVGWLNVMAIALFALVYY